MLLPASSSDVTAVADVGSSPPTLTAEPRSEFRGHLTSGQQDIMVSAQSNFTGVNRPSNAAAVKIEDTVLFSSVDAVAKSTDSTAPFLHPINGVGGALDQLIDSFTSTGLLQRSLSDEELLIVTQQIQLQMQQTQLQMLQLALRQQQLQAAQIQLKLQQQSRQVHDHLHSNYNHQQQQPLTNPPPAPNTVQLPSGEPPKPCRPHESRTVSPWTPTVPMTTSTPVAIGNGYQATVLQARPTSDVVGSNAVWTPSNRDDVTSAMENMDSNSSGSMDAAMNGSQYRHEHQQQHQQSPQSLYQDLVSNLNRAVSGHVTSTFNDDVVNSERGSHHMPARNATDGPVSTLPPPYVNIPRVSALTRRSPTASLEEIERFARMFKRRRIALGFTQCDVGMTMGKLYGNDFSQTTISRFEALNLSFKNMCKLKPLLEKWLDDVGATTSRPPPPPTASVSANVASVIQTNTSHGPAPPAPDNKVLPPSGPMSAMTAARCPAMDSIQASRRRKKRTNIDQSVRQALESFFHCVPKPTADQISDVAERLGMDRDVIQVWFCNRRQKEKRVHPGTASASTQPYHVTQAAPDLGLKIGHGQEVESKFNGLSVSEHILQNKSIT